MIETYSMTAEQARAAALNWNEERDEDDVQRVDADSQMAYALAAQAAGLWRGQTEEAEPIS